MGVGAYLYVRGRRPRAYLCALFVAIVVLLVAPSVASAITVSGNAYIDSRESGTWAGCTGGGQIGLAVDGVAIATTACNAAGAFSFAGVTLTSADQVLTLWFDGAAGNGQLYLRNANTTSNISALRIAGNRLGVESWTATSMTNAAIGMWDATNDADITPNYDGTQLLASTSIIHVAPSTTFAPGSDVTASGIRASGTWQAGAETTTLTNASPTPGGTATAGAGIPSCRSLWTYCSDGTGSFQGSSGILRFAGPAGVIGTVTGDYLGDTELMPTTATTWEWRGLGGRTRNLTLGDGVTTANLSYTNTDVVSDVVSVAAAFTATLGFASTITATSISGAGTVTSGLSNGGVGSTVKLRPTGGVATFGSTAGAAAWLVYRLELSNAGGVGNDATFRIAAGGTGSTLVRTELVVGGIGDLATSTLDLDTTDRVLDADRDVTVRSNGVLSASATAALSVGQRFDIQGAFQHNGGTVTFDTSTVPGRIVHAAPLAFGGLTISSTNKVVAFDASSTTTITGTFTALSTSCQNRYGIVSTVVGTRAPIDATGAVSLGYVDVVDINAVTPLTFPNSIDAGNNLGGTFVTPCALGGTVSGTVLSDQVGTVWSGCDGSTLNVAVSISFFGTRHVACDLATGVFTLPYSMPASGHLSAIWIDPGAPGARGINYSWTNGGNLTGVSVTLDHIRLRPGGATSFSGYDLSHFDSDEDPDVPITSPASGYDGSGLVTVPNGVEFLIEAGATFQNVGGLTTPALEVAGTITGAATVTLSGGGTSTSCTAAVGTQMPLCGAGAVGNSIDFRGTTATTIQTRTYASLSANPLSATPTTFTLGSTAGGLITTTSGGFAIQPYATVETSTYSPSLTGWITMNGALGGTGSGTFTLSSFNGSGTVDLDGGTVVSTTQIGAFPGPQTWEFNDLEFRRSGGTILPGASTTFVVKGNLAIGNVGDAASTVVNITSAAFDVDGDVIITSKGVLQASNTAAFTVASDFRNDGTFTAGTGTVTFDGATDTDVLGVPTTFSKLTVASPNKVVRFPAGQTTTVSSTLTTNGGACSTPVQLVSSSPGSQWSINATSTVTMSNTFVDDSNAVTPASGGGDGFSNNTGWTFTGSCSGAYDLYVDDANAQVGSANNTNVTSATPQMSIRSSRGVSVDAQQLQVVTTPTTGVASLWHVDGGTANAIGAGSALTLGTNPNDPAWGATQAGMGQSLELDGNDGANAVHSAGIALDTFTMEAWVQVTGAPGADGTEYVIATKGASSVSRNYHLVLVKVGGVLKARSSFSAGGLAIGPITGSTRIDDGRWHHVAVAVDSAPANPNKTHQLFVDGAMEANQTFTGNVDNPVNSLSIGSTLTYTSGLTGRLEEIRLSNVARTTAEIGGYVKLRLPHDQLMWDSGTVAMPACAHQARCQDVTYAGGSPLRNDGRYYVRGRTRAAVGGVWSSYGTYDWFEADTAATMVVSVPTGLTRTLDAVQPSSIEHVVSSIEITTGDENGYSLTATDPSDAASFTGASSLPDWTGTNATPTAWAAGLEGYAGVTVLSATSGKDAARWGTGTTATDMSNLLYVGLRSTSTTELHRRTGHSAVTDTVEFDLRVQPDAARVPGAYTSTIALTVIANP